MCICASSSVFFTWNLADFNGRWFMCSWINLTQTSKAEDICVVRPYGGHYSAKPTFLKGGSINRQIVKEPQ